MRALLWMTDSTPASNRGLDDPCPDGVSTHIHPPRNGVLIRVTDFPPERLRPANPEDYRRRGAITDPERSAKHPGFHKTNTIDYAICLEGEIWAVLDEGETLMRPGDVLIQRGAYHAWSNRSDQPCRMAFILIDAEPLEDH